MSYANNLKLPKSLKNSRTIQQNIKVESPIQYLAKLFQVPPNLYVGSHIL